MGLEQFDLPVFLLYHLLLTLNIILTIGVFLCLGLRTLELIKEPLLVFLAPHEAHMQVVLLLSLLVQNVLLLVEGLLKPCLVFFQAVGVLLTHYVLVLFLQLLRKDIVLNECLLEQAPQPHAFISISLDLVFAFLGLAHLDILFEFLNRAIFHRVLNFHLSILSF